MALIHILQFQTEIVQQADYAVLSDTLAVARQTNLLDIGRFCRRDAEESCAWWQVTSGRHIVQSGGRDPDIRAEHKPHSVSQF